MDAPQPTARERILACSRELYSERTFAQVSLKDIAEAAGVSVALVVKHFGSKDGLFEATVDFTTSSAALFAGPFADLGRTAVVETLTAPHNAPYSMARAISVAKGDEGGLNAIAGGSSPTSCAFWRGGSARKPRTAPPPPNCARSQPSRCSWGCRLCAASVTPTSRGSAPRR